MKTRVNSFVIAIGLLMSMVALIFMQWRGMPPVFPLTNDGCSQP